MPDPTPTTEATERQCPLMHHHAAHALCPGLTYDDVANMAEDAAFDAAAEQGRATADRFMAAAALTPTPDTLRAAAQDVRDALARLVEPSARVSLTLADRLRSAAATLDAALASPAPTDTPDERPCPSCGYRTLSIRPSGAESCASCGYATRPAAVTAPREDERADLRRQVLSKMTARRSQHWHGADTLLLRYEAALTVPREGPMSNNGPLTATNRPDVSHNDNAVERATPDPDTLAALLNDALRLASLRLNDKDAPAVARALIAAGVTLNETATALADPMTMPTTHEKGPR